MAENKRVKNIILITVDALRYDYLGCHNSELKKEKISPNIDKFIHQSVDFKKAFSQGPYTKSSFPAIFFSDYSSLVTEKIDEDLGRGRMKKDAKSWVEVLANNKINTAGFTTNPFTGRLLGYDRGFDYFNDSQPPFNEWLKRNFPKMDRALKAVLINRFKNLFSPTVFMDSEYISSKAFDWLERDERKRKKPFFLWLHYMDIHGPYWGDVRPTKMEENSNLYSKKRLIETYKKSVKYFDKSFSRLIKFLKRKGYLKNTGIVFTSDHGEFLGEKGSFSHPGQLYDPLIHVPLAFYWPGCQPKEENSLIGLIDLGPTIVDILMDEKIPGVKGRSYWQLLRSKERNKKKKKELKTRKAVISEVYSSSNKIPGQGYRPNYSVRTKDYKFIKFFKNNRRKFYDLKKDPKETNNIYQKEKKTAKKLKKLFKNEYGQKNTNG